MGPHESICDLLYKNAHTRMPPVRSAMILTGSLYRIAFSGGRVDVARVLLGHGADVNPRDDDHSTALHLVVLEGRVDVVRLLIQVEDGAAVNSRHNDQWLVGLSLARDVHKTVTWTTVTKLHRPDSDQPVVNLTT